MLLENVKRSLASLWFLYIIFILFPAIFFSISIPRASTYSFLFPSDRALLSMFAIIYYLAVILISARIVSQKVKSKSKYSPILLTNIFVLVLTLVLVNLALVTIIPLTIYKTAVIMGNPNICHFMEKLKGTFYYHIEIRDCVTEIATNKKNHSLCYALKLPDECILFTSIHLKSIQLCDSFVPEVKSECYYGMALDAGTIKSCNNDSGCISKYINYRRNKSVCYDLPASDLSDCDTFDLNLSKCILKGREWCFSQLAIWERNADYCSEIHNYEASGKCLAVLANYYYYPKYCEPLRNNAAYYSCVDIARERIPSPESCDNSSNKSQCLLSIIIKTDDVNDCGNDSGCYFLYAKYKRNFNFCLKLPPSNFSNCIADRAENLLDNCTFTGRENCVMEVTLLKGADLREQDGSISASWCGLLDNYWAAAKCYTEYALTIAPYVPYEISSTFCSQEIEASNPNPTHSYEKYCLQKLKAVKLG